MPPHMFSLLDLLLYHEMNIPASCHEMSMSWVGAGLRKIGHIWNRLRPNLQLLEQITAKASMNSSQPIDKRARNKCLLLYTIEF